MDASETVMIALRRVATEMSQVPTFNVEILAALCAVADEIDKMRRAQSTVETPMHMYNCGYHSHENMVEALTCEVKRLRAEIAGGK